jgi:hypothetical protein
MHMLICLLPHAQPYSHVHVQDVNGKLLTYDGVDVCGDRLVRSTENINSDDSPCWLDALRSGMFHFTANIPCHAIA